MDTFDAKPIEEQSPYEFEHFVADLFRRRGYAVLVTQQSGDYGADLILDSELARIAVQVKHYGEANKVGVTDVTHILGAKQYYGCDSALIVTTSGFTKAAEDMATKGGVRLWDGQALRDFASNVGYKPKRMAGGSTVVPCSPESLEEILVGLLSASQKGLPNLFFIRPIGFEMGSLLNLLAEKPGLRFRIESGEALQK